jgi:hypothetical protein
LADQLGVEGGAKTIFRCVVIFFDGAQREA